MSSTTEMTAARSLIPPRKNTGKWSKTAGLAHLVKIKLAQSVTQANAVSNYNGVWFRESTQFKKTNKLYHPLFISPFPVAVYTHQTQKNSFSLEMKEFIQRKLLFFFIFERVHSQFMFWKSCFSLSFPGRTPASHSQRETTDCVNDRICL